MTKKIKRIALIGPESTGKTTLCEQLAAHYKTVWVSEYARGYVEKFNRPYTIQDVELCAKRQLEQEDKFLQRANQYIFSDTELIVSKVWSEDVFKSCPDWMEKEILKRKYDLYLLTFPDLPFKEDPVRENQHRRAYFFELYQSELERRNFSFEIVTGIGEVRLENALKAIQNKKF